MILSALLVLALGQAPQPHTGAEVALEARAVVIPALPATPAEARRDYGKVRLELEASYREAERYLAACNADLAALGPVEDRVTVPAKAAGEAKFLTQFLFDSDFLALEDPLLTRWNAWQSALLAEGLANPREARRMAGNMLLLSSTKTEIVDRTAVKAGQTALEIVWDDPAGAPLRLPRRIQWVEILAVNRMQYGAHTEFGVKATALAETQATALAQAWAPLVAHLNTHARALLDLDRTAPPTQDPGLKSLRLLARINFMERFRSTLWFCQVVWAHLASEKILSIHEM